MIRKLVKNLALVLCILLIGSVAALAAPVSIFETSQTPNTQIDPDRPALKTHSEEIRQLTTTPQLLPVPGSTTSTTDEPELIRVSVLHEAMSTPTPASPVAPRRFGLGVIIGEPTGATAKFWLTKTRALDAAIAWSFIDETNLQLHVDYVFHNYELLKGIAKEFKMKQERLSIYYGLGGQVRFGDDSRFGLRVPIGVSYILVGDPGDPVEIFVEAVPVVDLAPEVDVRGNVVIGARFYFK